MHGARSARRACRTGFLVLLLAAVAAPDDATAKRVRLRGGSGLTGSAAADLSLGQLRTCLALEDSINKEGDAFDAKKAKMDETSKKLDAAEADLKKRKATVDTTSKAAVDKFNKDAGAYRAQVAAYNQDVTRQKAAAADINAKAAKFNAECSKKTYRESDYQTVSAEIAQANAVQAAAKKK